ncbi:MAG: alpha-mannosidase [Brevinema sp.]
MDTTKRFKLEHFKQRSLESYRYRFYEEQVIESFFSLVDPDENNGKKPLKKDNTWETYSVGESIWTAHDSYMWLHATVAIPSNWKSKKPALVIEGISYCHKGSVRIHDYSGPIAEPKWMGIELMCFLNQKPFQGIDDNHPVVLLPEEVIGTSIEIDLRVWSGTDRTSKNRPFSTEIRKAQICLIDTRVESFYFWSTALLQTICQLEETHPNHPPLYTLLDQAHKIIRWQNPGSEEFRNSCEQATLLIEKTIPKIPKHHIATDYATGHTHLDVAWLWRIKHVIEKTARSWSTAIQNLKEDPEFKFLQSQAQLYAYIKEYYPDLYKDIKYMVEAKRWDPNGAMWVEADCNLSGGESLTRQILYGKQFFKDEFNIDSSFLWLPDVFGYSIALPQILKKSGVHTFITSKISWNQYNRMPHDLFWWKGLDGTKILTTFIVTPEPKPRENWYYTYNAQMTVEVVTEAWEAFQDKDVVDIFVHPYGWGDGGGGTTYEQLHLRQKLEKMPGIPNIKSALTSEFCTDLHKKVEFAPVPLYTGELYLEYHRGTYTSQADIKRYNRKNELALCHTELILSWNFLVTKKTYDKEEYKKLWHLYLVNQFHDILPGSSIHNVYIDARNDHKQIETKLNKIRQNTIKELVESKPLTWTVFNPLLHKRQDIQKISYFPEAEQYLWTDYKGSPLKIQKVENELWISDLSIPSCGWTTIHAEKTTPPQYSSPFQYKDHFLESPLYIIEWNNSGQIIRFYDKKYKRELLVEGQSGNILELLEDKPRNYDAWEFEPYAAEKTSIITNLTKTEVVTDGSNSIIIRFHWDFNNSVIIQDMTVYSSSPKIDFITYVDWKEREQILRSAWTADIIPTNANAYYDIQYGNVARPVHQNTSWDVARFEVCAHRWADLSEREYGFSILNDGKYGYSATENTLRITLLKGSNLPDNSADLHEHRFTYSLLPHQGDWIQGKTVSYAAELNAPCYIFEGQSVLPSHSLLSVSPEIAVELDAFKLAEDSNKIIIRIHEYEGKREKFILSPGFEFSSWEETDLMEQVLDVGYSKEIPISLKGYEIKTYALTIE